MLKIKPSRGNTDAAIMTSLRVVGREGSRVGETPKAEAMAGTSALHQPLQSFVPADLKDHQAGWMRWFEKEVEAKFQATGSGLEIIADVLQEGMTRRESSGPVFFNGVGEDRTFSGESFTFAGEQKEHLRRFIEQLAARMGVRHPDIAAGAAVLVIDETFVRTQMSASPEETRTARLLFQCLQHA